MNCNCLQIQGLYCVVVNNVDIASINGNIHFKFDLASGDCFWGL